MDFSPPDKVSAFLPLVRDFMRREVLPLEPLLRQNTFAQLLPVLKEKRARAKETGLFGAFMPKEVGGAGFSLIEMAYLGEELGKSPLGHYVFNCQAPDAGNMELLLAHGTPAQKEKWLVPLVRGDLRSCFTMTEPDFPGANPTWMGTTAKRAQDAWVLEGQKWFSTAVDGAAFAICMAVTNPDAPPYERASMFLVPTDSPGFVRVRNISVMGDGGSDYASHAEVSYQGCRVPSENLLGAEGAGFLLAQERLGPGRIHHCMRWIGVCERAFDLMCERAVSRQLSPGKPLGTRQVVQHWIAHSRAEIHSARLMVLHAAWRIEKEGAYAAREEVSLIKFTVANVLQRVLDRAVQVHGAAGLTDDTPLAYWYAHERAARIYDGPDEVHLDVVAKRILRERGLAPAKS